MTATFKYLTSLLFVAIVIQVGMAGVGAFNAIDKADKDGTVTKKQIEDGFGPHGLFGTVVFALILLVVIFAFLAKADSMLKRLAVGLVALGALQALFAWLATKHAALGFLHGINALALYAAAALLAHRAWTRDKNAPAPAA
jgi:hypothetical protein